MAVTDQSEPSAHALGRRIGKTAPPSASAPAVAPPATALVAEGLFLGAGAGAGHMAAVAGPSSEPSSYAPNTALTGGYEARSCIVPCERLLPSCPCVCVCRASAVYAAVMADRAGRPANLKKPAPEGLAAPLRPPYPPTGCIRVLVLYLQAGCPLVCSTRFHWRRTA